MVNASGEEFFAGATLSEQEHGGFCRSYALELLTDGFHGRRIANDARKPVTRGKFFAKDEIFAQQFLLTRSAFDENLQVIEIYWLLDEIECAVLHGGNGFFHRAECGQQDHRDRDVGLPGFTENFEA